MEAKITTISFAKLFLDDIRTPPDETWTLVNNVPDMILLCSENEVTHISLDHDLGDTDPDHSGYDFMCWLEEAVFLEKYDKYSFPDVKFHTDNPVGRNNMKRSLDHIHRMLLS